MDAASGGAWNPKSALEERHEMTKTHAAAVTVAVLYVTSLAGTKVSGRPER
jgi:hypothetical protein